MRTKRFLLAAALMLTAATSAFAQKSFTLNLWPSKPAVVGSDDKDTALVQVFLPREKVATGRAVVICPGGGYQTLARLGSVLQRHGHCGHCVEVSYAQRR